MVYCKILGSVKAASLEVERAMFTSKLLFPFLLSSIQVLILAVNNQKQFMLYVTKEVNSETKCLC